LGLIKCTLGAVGELEAHKRIEGVRLVLSVELNILDFTVNEEVRVNNCLGD